MGRLPGAISAPASGCAPVPQSRISSSPLAVVTSTQDVLPPKWFVPRPGVAIEPRVPQKRTFIGSLALRRRELAQHSAALDTAGRTSLAAHPAHAILAILGWLLLAAKQPVALEVRLAVVEVPAL